MARQQLPHACAYAHASSFTHTPRQNAPQGNGRMLKCICIVHNCPAGFAGAGQLAEALLATAETGNPGAPSAQRKGLALAEQCTSSLGDLGICRGLTMDMQVAFMHYSLWPQAIIGHGL